MLLSLLTEEVDVRALARRLEKAYSGALKRIGISPLEIVEVLERAKKRIKGSYPDRQIVNHLHKVFRQYVQKELIRIRQGLDDASDVNA
jgi:hypothetical protein